MIVLIICYTSWRLDKRNMFLTIGSSIVIPGYIIFLATTNGTARYVATFLVAAGSLGFGAYSQSQASANVVSDTTRSAAIGTYQMLGNIGGLISTWSFLPADGPNYPVGNGLNLAANLAIVIGTIMLGYWMAMDNKKRDRQGQAVRIEVEQQDRKQIQDLDRTRPNFRWRPYLIESCGVAH